MIGSGELIVILCVMLLLFGGKKLPEFARSLGKGIREFKKACNEDCNEIQDTEIQITKKTAEKQIVNDET